MRRVYLLAALMAVLVLPVLAPGQAPAAAQPAGQVAMSEVTAAILPTWNNVGRKLVNMAVAFPEDKYSYKATPEVRTFAEHLLHAIASNDGYIARLKGGKPSGEQPAKTKAAIVEALKKSFADGAAFIPQISDVKQLRGLAGMIEHSGEIYGTLVVYFRVNGMVPPETEARQKKK